MNSNNNDSSKQVEDDGLGGGKISSWAPAAAVSSTATNSEDLSVTLENDQPSMCPHLEELMFPKFLSLDCNKLDEFCMGRVTDRTNAGRIYIEALHLKDFLKDTDTLTKEYNKKGRLNKRASPSRSPAKKKSRAAEAKDSIADEKALSQTFWGGMEGKRTWILSNSDIGIAGTYCGLVPQVRSSQEDDPILQELHAKKILLDPNSSDEALDILLNSELRLRTLRKTFKLHDKTAMFDNYVCNTSDDALPPQDDEFKVLEDLAKPLPGIQPPSFQNTNPQGAATANEKKNVEKNTEANKAPLTPSTLDQPTTMTNEPMDAKEKVAEIASQTLTMKEIASTEQVVTSDAKPSSTSQNPPVLLSQQAESSTPMEVEDKATEITSPKIITDDNRETKTITTPSVENPQDQLAVSSTSKVKQSSEKDKERSPKSSAGTKATATQRQRPSSLNETVIEETMESLHKRAVHEGKDASFAANKMLCSFRQNRRRFWNASNKSEMSCVWCSSRDEATIKSTNKHPAREFGVIKDARVSKEGDHCDNALVACASGDNLIQCLECNLIGCRSGFAGGKSHAMLHFLMSGHKYGVTCGESGEIFCMGCGDIVHHECFDRERERVFLEQNHPSLCWQESPINRGINPSSFTVTREQGYVWRGLLASYPIPAPTQFVRAGQFALRRLLMFRGCSTSKMVVLGPNALKLAMHRQAHCKLFCLLSHYQNNLNIITDSFSPLLSSSCSANDRLIPTPVGLYNLGNTCYMNSTLQCLIHCVPLQETFLKDLAHPYQCCAALKGGETSCLACEIDKLFLEHFGSSVGIDAIAALEEQCNNMSNASDANGIVPNEPSPDHCGHPVIPSNFLAEVWKNSAVRHLARHDQHDAQEFYHAFIDVLETDVLSCQKTLRDMQHAIKNQSQIRTSQPLATPPQSSIKDIFEGSLRSVLICDECGCKRSQIESFLNLSLPLKNEFPSQPEVATKEKMTTRSETSNINACLKHFTDPETLSDPIYCPSCNKKTKNLKQHTFSKLPRVLCLHLKRFDAANNKKISDFVSYPASDLDMGKYLPHWCEKILSTENKDDDTNQTDADSPKVLYDLFATVNHKGTLNQGHYTSNVKCGNHWYHCNDAFICDAGEGNGEKEVLLAEGAYMLFYRRKDWK